jgi:hypothetical protein
MREKTERRRERERGEREGGQEREDVYVRGRMGKNLLQNYG